MTKLDVKVTTIYGEGGATYHIHIDLDTLIAQLKDRALEAPEFKKEYYKEEIKEYEELKLKVIEWASKQDDKKTEEKPKKTFWQKLFR